MVGATVCTEMTIYLVMVVLAMAPESTASPRAERFWPLKNSSDEVDLPQSSPFGPRYKISAGSRYDYHRGVDIPADVGTTVYAIDDAEVRIGGLSHSAFSDGVVQLLHTGWDDEGDTSKKYYSTYLHLSASYLEGMEGTNVSKGQPIGLTGTTTFAHLHFEIRAGGLRQDSNCNPWKFLPCEDCHPFKVNVNVIPNEDGEECSATVQVSVPPNQLTFNRVRLVASGGMSTYNQSFDLCADNMLHTSTPTYDPGRLDNATLLDYLTISPHFFNSQSFSKNQSSTTSFKFKNLPMIPEGASGTVTTYVHDIFEHEADPITMQYICSGPTSSPPTSSPTTTQVTPMQTTSSNIEMLSSARVIQISAPIYVLIAVLSWLHV